MQLSIVYGCGNVLQTTAESSNTPLTHCTQQVKQYLNISTCFPQAYNLTPCKWLKLFSSIVRAGMVIPPLEWMLLTFFASKIPQLLPVESKQRAHRQASLVSSYHWWLWQINSSHYNSSESTCYNLVPMNNNPWGCYFFSGMYIKQCILQYYDTHLKIL